MVTLLRIKAHEIDCRYKEKLNNEHEIGSLNGFPPLTLFLLNEMSQKTTEPRILTPKHTAPHIGIST